MFRYEETVSFDPVVQFLYLLGVAGVVWAQLATVPNMPWVPAVVGVPLILLPLMFGRLRIRMDAEMLTTEFGYLGWPMQRVPITNMCARASCRTVRFSNSAVGESVRVDSTASKRRSTPSAGRRACSSSLPKSNGSRGFAPRGF